MIKPEDDGHCFICGGENQRGLRLEFKTEGASVRASFRADKTLQGYKDVVHGGIIAALLDEAMVKAAIANGFNAVTAEMTVKFKSPLPVGEDSIVEGSIEEKGRILRASAEVRTASDGKPIASASGKLISIKG